MHQISFWFFQRGINPEREITQRRKKMCVSYFSMRNPYMKFQKPSMRDFWRWTDARTHAHMHGQPETNMHHQLLWSWGHKNWLIMVCHNPNLDLVSIKANAKFGQNPSICSHDTERKWMLTWIKAHNSITNCKKLKHNPNLDFVSINEYANFCQSP